MAVAVSPAAALDEAAAGRSCEGLAALPWPVLAAGVALALECVGAAAVPHPGTRLGQAMGAPIVFFLALMFFGRKSLRVTLAGAPVGWGFAALHGCALAVMAATSALMLRAGAPYGGMAGAGRAVWFGTMGVLGVSLVLAVVPPERVAGVARGLGRAWGYAGLCAGIAVVSRGLAQATWTAQAFGFGRMMQAATFRGVAGLLRVFYRGVVEDPARSTVGTARFQVEVAGLCSGVEGLALILVLTLGWMVFARRELRLARAVWLVPAALATMWGLNLVRIAALIAIGDAGHPEVAVTGFHSEAGWILFNVVGLGFLTTAQHLRWVRRDGAGDAGRVRVVERNVAAIYLLPFLAIVAATLVSKAMSAGFEWAYGLRLVAAAGVLWGYRAEYRRMDWRFGWLGLAVGVAVFGMWLGLDRVYPGMGSNGIAAGLAGLGGWKRVGWLAGRVLAAVVTVPVAEELAFRGYVARRLMAEDVERVSYAGLSWVAVGVSAAVFGAMHGRMWVAGLVAGVVFAVVARVKGRLGEAVAAHAMANLLIAVWVLAGGDYSLW